MSVPTKYRYGECRLLGHSWHLVPSDWSPKFGEPMTSRCERCDIERRDSVNRFTGEVESRRYTYPDGYLFTRELDIDPPRRVDFRVAWLDEQLARQRVERSRDNRRPTDNGGSNK